MRRMVFLSLLLCFFTPFLMGQVFTFSLSGETSDYKKLRDSIANAKKLADSNNGSIQTTTDSSGYFFDGKKIKRNRGTQASNGAGQENKLTLSGKVTDCKTKKPIKDAELKLVCSNGSSLTIKSDDKGNYLFDSNSLKSNLACVIHCGAPPIITGNIFLNSSEKIKFQTFDTISNKNIVADFCLVPNNGCTILNFPTIYFQKNDLKEYHTKEIDSMNFTLSEMVEILKDNPTLVIEISGHSSTDEKNVQLLSDQRAEYIKKALIKDGIEPDRLFVKGYGSKKPAMEFSDSVLTQEKKEPIQMSRRVSFTILRKDYLPK